jgi:hypothetical protein
MDQKGLKKQICLKLAKLSEACIINDQSFPVIQRLEKNMDILAIVGLLAIGVVVIWFQWRSNRKSD